jgi:hypothetical protein
MQHHLGPEAAKPLSAAERARLGANGPVRDGDDGAVCLMPVPPDAGPPPEIKVKGRKADHQFAYRARDGLLGYVFRWEARDDDRKEFRPVTYWRDARGKCEWKVKTWPAGKRPLCGLAELAANPEATVLLVEGEKTKEAVERGPLAEAFMWAPTKVIGVTWPGGGEAVKYADFSPLKGRNVIILPDAHAPGEDTADSLVEILQKVGVGRLRRWRAPPEVKQVKSAWDIANEIPPGWMPDALVKNIFNAPEMSREANVYAADPQPWWRDPAAIPPRQFLHGRHYIRRSVGAPSPPAGRSSASPSPVR